MALSSRRSFSRTRAWPFSSLSLTEFSSSATCFCSAPTSESEAEIFFDTSASEAFFRTRSVLLRSIWTSSSFTLVPMAAIWVVTFLRSSTFSSRDCLMSARSSLEREIRSVARASSILAASDRSFSSLNSWPPLAAISASSLAMAASWSMMNLDRSTFLCRSASISRPNASTWFLAATISDSAMSFFL